MFVNKFVEQFLSTWLFPIFAGHVFVLLENLSSQAGIDYILPV
jgi:hypothetical protein